MTNPTESQKIEHVADSLNDIFDDVLDELAEERRLDGHIEHRTESVARCRIAYSLLYGYDADVILRMESLLRYYAENACDNLSDWGGYE